MPTKAPHASPVVWEDDGPPRSRVHGDVYFSRDDGLAEARAVFLAGCGLPEAWADRRQYTVAELGFGAGLNVAALLLLWERTRAPGAHLSIFTIEAAPLTASEAGRALAPWPELGSVAALLIGRWPGMARGFHRVDLPELAATIDVAIMEAAEALTAWSGLADAWFLDGFSPALDPAIWRQEVMNLVGRRSAPGARAATYTVAGVVRRGLAEAGFSVERAPGHARKRQRLQARLPGEAAGAPPPRVAVVGAGIAGASLRRALRALGAEATVFDAERPGSGASGAPAGLMAPRLDAGLGTAAALFAQAAHRAAQLYDATPGAVIATGALQLPVGPKDPGRFDAIAAADLFEVDDMVRSAATDTTARLGEPAPEALAMRGARVVDPAVVLDAWLGDVARARVAAVERAGGVWRLLDEAGAVLFEADAVCVAAAMGSCELVPELDLTPVRGQASVADGIGWPIAAVFGAYVIPTRTGVLFGATHDRGETTTETRLEDRRRNLQAVEAVLPVLASRAARGPLTEWSAIRATTSDYLPLAGPVPDADDGLLILTGLGSRGLCLAPLLAEHLAAGLMGAPSPLPYAAARLVDPGRFAERASRRGRPRFSPKV